MCFLLDLPFILISISSILSLFTKHFIQLTHQIYHVFFFYPFMAFVHQIFLPLNSILMNKQIRIQLYLDK